jgi:hypothetical protein
MLWIAIGTMLVVAVLLLAVVSLFRRPNDDLGFVSAHWVAQHRVDSP